MRARSGSSSSSSGSSGRCAGAMAPVLPPRSLASSLSSRRRLRLRLRAGGAPRAWRSRRPASVRGPPPETVGAEKPGGGRRPRRGTEARGRAMRKELSRAPRARGLPSPLSPLELLGGSRAPPPAAPRTLQASAGPRPGQTRADSAADPQGPAPATRNGQENRQENPQSAAPAPPGPRPMQIGPKGWSALCLASQHSGG